MQRFILVAAILVASAGAARAELATIAQRMVFNDLLDGMKISQGGLRILHATVTVLDSKCGAPGKGIKAKTERYLTQNHVPFSPFMEGEYNAELSGYEDNGAEYCRVYLDIVRRGVAGKHLMP